MFTTGFQGIFLAQCVGRNFLGKLCSYGFLEGNVTPGVEWRMGSDPWSP